MSNYAFGRKLIPLPEGSKNLSRKIKEGKYYDTNFRGLVNIFNYVGFVSSCSKKVIPLPRR